MHRVKLLALGVAAVLFAGAGVVAAAMQQEKTAESTWTGKISDSMCGADHKANGGTLEKDHACTLDCVKTHGSQYIFVNTADKKIYKIGNQKLAGLEQHAGHNVEIAGTIQDDTITVTKVTMKK